MGSAGPTGLTLNLTLLLTLTLPPPLTLTLTIRTLTLTLTLILPELGLGLGVWESLSTGYPTLASSPMAMPPIGVRVRVAARAGDRGRAGTMFVISTTDTV